jgi:protease-4
MSALASLLLAAGSATAQETAAADSPPTAKSDNKPTAEKAEVKTESPPPKKQKVRVAKIELEGSLPEASGSASLFAESQSDLRTWVERLEKAAKDKSIAAAVLELRNPTIGSGKVEEVRGAITRFRASGKKIYAQLESAMPEDYLIACACDEIVLPESGELVLPGIHAEATFYKGLFNKLGVEADFVHIGAYKGAAEPLTQDGYSEPVRENLNQLIDSMYDELVTTIVKHRPVSVAQAEEAIDRGMISATKAKELGLVDRVAYPNELKSALADLHNAEPLVYVENYGEKAVEADLSGPTGILKLMQTMMGSDQKSPTARGKKIAVIYATGAITTGESASDLLGESVLGSTTIIEALQEADRDEQVVAIVLRIDSPGGSALASDLIWHETQVIDKPIVASMGDYAASGGYYIAMGADKIIAAPGTVTGSIGVVGGKVAVKGLFEKLGVTTETIQRGKNSGIFAMSGKFTESERRVVLDSMEEVYRQFTEKAAAGRNMPVEKLRELAGGRVYSGRQAKENGLVDELGTLHDAIASAKVLAGLERDAAVRIEVMPEPTSILDALFETSEGEKEVLLRRSIESISPELAAAARKVNRLRMMFDRPAALVMPFELEVR